MMYLLFAIYVLLSSSGLVLFKIGTFGTGFSLFGFNITIKMIVGIFFYGISFLLWMYIVSKINLTIAMPFSVALVNTLVVVESCLFLKEKISVMQGLGIFIIIFGVIMITIGNK